MNGTFTKWKLNKKFVGKFLTVVLVMFAITPVFASGGAGALGSAATSIRGYVQSLSKLIYAIGVVVGIVGGIRIYNKWTNGDQDINKEIVGWGGAALFVTLVPTFIQAIFPA